MAGTSRFDCFPSDFLNGVIGLTADQIAAYTVIMMLQYDLGAPVAFVGRERLVAVRSGMSIGRVKAAVMALRGLGKLILNDDGTLENGRTTRELAKIDEKLAKNRENSIRGGNANREIWEQKRLENNEGLEPNGYPNGYPKHSPIPSSPVLLPPKEEDPSDLCPKPVRTRKAYPEDFEEFWGAYPTDSNMSKAEALKPWQRLSEADKRDAAASLSAFRRYCASHPDYRPVHANRYLSQRRWEGHLKTAAAVQERVFVHQESPQWIAWQDYLRKTKGRASPVDQAGGWHFPTEWPPKLEERVH